MARNVTFTFGLFSFAAKLDGAVTKPESLSNLCPGQPGKDAHDPLPVKQPKVCTACGPITDFDVLKKGRKQGSTYALIEQADVAEAKETYSKEYKGALNFVPHPAQDFLAATAPGESLNYITPADASGAGHYRLMVELVKAHPELAFVTLHTPQSATSLFMLQVRDDVLVLEQRARSQALKPAPSVGGDLNEQLFAMLDSQIGVFTTPYDPAAYEDRYELAVQALAEAGETVTVGAAAAPAVTTTSDDEIMAKLKALQGSKPAPKKRAAKKTAAKATAA